MRKSRVVELVLLNSVLALSGCTRVCHIDEKKDDKPGERVVRDDDKGPVAQNTCRGRSSHYHGGGGHIFYHGGGGGGRSTTRPGTSTVGRGGFGTTGHAAS
jgi:hypothetical protein